MTTPTVTHRLFTPSDCGSMIESRTGQPAHRSACEAGGAMRHRITRLTRCAMIPGLLASLVALQPAAPATADESDGSRIMLVMDASGSMAEPAASTGLSKIRAARTSLNTVIDDLPASQQLGLRVYGAQVFSKDDPGACTDSQLVVPVGPDNRTDLRDAVSRYKPYGETPIGYALDQAADDLGDTGRRNIILVSDGESTCQPDPCRVARDLRRGGINVRIDVVGLDVNTSAREQLRCIADVGRGIYYDTHDSDELTESLSRVAERAARPYKTIGEQVTGTPKANDAPTIDSGDWVDQVEGGQQDRYYRVQRSMQNSTVYVSAAYRTPGEKSSVTVSLYGPDGQPCGSGVGFRPFAHGQLLGTGAIAGALDPIGEAVDPDNPCLTSTELLAKLSYNGPGNAIPVEIRVSELPAITNPDDLATPPTRPKWSAPAGDSTRVRGGTSFADAETLKPGGYQGTIVPGETLTFATDVDWGEQLDVNAIVDRLNDATDEAGEAGEGSPSASLQIYGPSRIPASTTDAKGGGLLVDTESVGVLAPADLAQTTGPVDYANLTDEAVAGASQPGTYTITLYLEDSPENASLPVPYTLGIGLTDHAVSEPAFDKQAIDTDDDDAGSAAPVDDGGDTASAADGGDGGTSGTLVALLVAGLLALGAVWLLRRRQARPALAGTAYESSAPMGTAATPQPNSPARAPTREYESAARDEQAVHLETTVPANVTAAVAHLLDAARPAGLGLAGPGAAGAARSIIVALLADVPDDGRPIRVVVPEPDLVHVLDGASPTRSPVGLSTDRDLDEALDQLEAEIVTRTRLADANADDEVSASAPPPLILVARPEIRRNERLRAVLDNGAAHGIAGILLGDWQPVTAHVTSDGSITIGTDDENARARSSQRLPGIPAARAAARLDDLASTQSAVAEHGRSQPPGPPEPPTAARSFDLEMIQPATDGGHAALTGAEPDPTDSVAPHQPIPADPDGQPDTKAPLRLSVLGRPELVWTGDEEVDLTDQLSGRVLETVVFLALHPDGARRDAIAATLWPDSPTERPNGLYKATARLRQIVADATGNADADPLLISDGTYGLDPSVVDVDYWTFIAALAAGRAASTDGDRQGAYERVVATYTGELADGLEVDWIDIPRQATRRDAVDAVSRLAQQILETEPSRTLDLLETALGFDPYNESLYRDIMRLQRRVGQTSAIPRTLALLTTRLAELDEEPEPGTLELAEALQRHGDQTDS